MEVINNKKVKTAILKTSPIKIAVAYIGIDWGEYIKLSQDHIIIVSPTIGTNPKAIEQIVDIIGWKNVYFLDKLHAKIFIGRDMTFLSSSNLSKNGIEVDGLIEIGVLIESERERKIIEVEFDKILDLAKKEYKDTKSKQIALQNLYDKHRIAVANKIIKKQNLDTNRLSFQDYKVLTDNDFYICWYMTGGVKYSNEYKLISKNIVDEIHFRKEDNVKIGKWVLIWKLTSANLPHKTEKPFWIFIHGVLEDAIIEDNYPYPNCAYQINNQELPDEPFDLNDGRFIKLFKELIAEKPHKKYFIQEDDFKLNFSQRGFISLMEAIKEKY